MFHSMVRWSPVHQILELPASVRLEGVNLDSVQAIAFIIDKTPKRSGGNAARQTGKHSYTVRPSTKHPFLQENCYFRVQIL